MANNTSQDESTIQLTKAQLEDMLKSASYNAQIGMDNLKNELSQAKAREDATTARLEHLEENQAILFGIISKLRSEKDLQPKQQDRSEILLALLRDNDGKMFAKDARNKMGVGKATFSVLLKSMQAEIDKRPYHLNKSQLVISLKV